MKSFIAALCILFSVSSFANTRVPMDSARDMINRYAKILIYTNFTADKTAVCDRKLGRAVLPCVFKAKMNTTGIIYQIEINADGQIHSMEKIAETRRRK